MKKAIKYFTIVLFLMILFSCVAYSPFLYVSYDVLNPGIEVRLNPIAWVENNEIINDDGEKISVIKGVVVNDAYILWTYELKQEIVRLRKLLEEK